MLKSIINFKSIMIVLILISIAVLSGCTTKEIKVADDKGNMLMLTESEIGGSDFPYGFYVLNDTGENRLFTPLMRDTPGYQKADAQTDTGRFFWWLDGKNKDGTMIIHEKLVPTVTSKTPLVAIYDVNNDLPVSCILERYKYVGFTFGGKFLVGDDDQTIYFMKDEDEILKGSSFESCAEKINEDNDGLVEVLSINGDNAEKYIGNIDTEVNILTGFDKDDYMKYFDVEYALGTKTHTMKPLIDTQAFKFAGSMELSTPFTRTKNGYYIVNLPENLDEGYYYINDFGLFKYENKGGQQ